MGIHQVHGIIVKINGILQYVLKWVMYRCFNKTISEYGIIPIIIIYFWASY